MGKKPAGKKDEKAAAEDVFDPLNIQSKDAATVVLMLESPEEEVQAKACEAIFQFVKKCDDNKRLILDLSGIEPLLHLSKSEEKSVRRNSIMCLGVMTSHIDIRRHIRKTPDCTQIFLKLLNPEEFTTTIEFATLCLRHMCEEFSTIAIVVENSGLEMIIEGLKNDDPDVQKNSAECLSLLLQDFEVRSTIKDLGALEALLELLKSEYNLIQQLALECFIKATHETSIRTALREMEALREFVEIIGKPEFNDLHVYAINVLANCSEDFESIQQLKECGALGRYLAFITDTQPPEEESKGDKGGKKKGSAKGKKKGGDEKADGEKLPSHTMPEVKMHACRAIARSSRNAENKKIMHESEAEKSLVLLVSHDDEAVRVAAATALAVLAENALCQDAIAKYEGIEPLLKMVKSEHEEPKEAGTYAIANLTTSNMNNCQDVCLYHGIEILLTCLSHTNERVVSNSLNALSNMAVNDSLREKAISCGLVSALVAPLQSDSTLVQSKSTLTLASFLCDQESQNQLKGNGSLDAITSMLMSNHANVRRNACWAIAVLSSNIDLAQEFYKMEALGFLRSMNQSETRKNRFTEAALKTLLDNNIIAKYALTGHLSEFDIVPNVFFDPGAMKPDARVVGLSVYATLPVNSRRPILLINAEKQERVPPPTEPSESRISSSRQSQHEKPKKSGKSPRGSAKNHSKSKKEVVETQTEDEPVLPPPPVVQEYQPPEDLNLLRYIEEVTRSHALLPTKRDQVVSLACFVAEKMGGPIAKGQTMNFSYELPITQLKKNLKSNVIPIGLISSGIHYHRALLYKFLADRLGLGVTLNRGEYNRAWNTMLLSADEDAHSVTKFPPSNFIVDLIHEPGKLMRFDSIEATNYMSIHD